MDSIYDSPLVAAAAKQLLRAANERTSHAAKRGMQEFRDSAYESDATFEAAFLAAQMLRDLDRIDHDEMAYVLDYLFDDPLKRRRRFDASTFAFYRAHGESELATKMEKRRATYVQDTFDGELSLIAGKPPGGDRPVVDTEASVADIAERALALSAAAAKPDRVREWNNFVRAARTVSVRAAVGAIRSLREIKTLTPHEYAALVNTVIEPAIDQLCDADRLIHRLRRAAGPEGHKIVGASPADRSRRRNAQRRLTVRLRRVRAAYLRQLGEHDLANLLRSKPLLYELQVVEGPLIGSSAEHTVLDRIRKQLAEDD